MDYSPATPDYVPPTFDRHGSDPEDDVDYFDAGVKRCSSAATSAYRRVDDPDDEYEEDAASRDLEQRSTATTRSDCDDEEDVTVDEDDDDDCGRDGNDETEDIVVDNNEEDADVENVRNGTKNSADDTDTAVPLNDPAYAANDDTEPSGHGFVGPNHQLPVSDSVDNRRSERSSVASASRSPSPGTAVPLSATCVSHSATSTVTGSSSSSVVTHPAMAGDAGSKSNVDAHRAKPSRPSKRSAASQQQAAARADSVASTSSASSRKRKLQTVNVSLLHFAHALWEAYLDTRVTEEPNKRFVAPKNLLAYLRFAPNNDELLHHLDALGVLPGNGQAAKRFRDQQQSRPAVVADSVTIDADDGTRRSANDANESSSEAKEASKQSIMLQLMLRLMMEIEGAGIGYQFSREALKCFLATYSRLITPDDFGNARIAEAMSADDTVAANASHKTTNGSRKRDKNGGTTASRSKDQRSAGGSSRNGQNGGASNGNTGSLQLPATGNVDRHNNKSNTPLPPGGILLEYVKGVTAFLSNVNRSDPNDLYALCFILRHGISLQSGVYAELYRVRVDDLVYETDRQYLGNEPGYARIPAQNFKRVVLLLGHSVILQLDGRHFVVPSMNIERDVPSSEIPRQRGEYVVLDVMLGTRTKVLDVLACRMNGVGELPRNYLDRLRWIGDRFPGLKCVTVASSTTANDFDSGYVRKPLNDPRGTSYVYAKPPLTAAVVGFANKQAYLAFREHRIVANADNNSSTGNDSEPPRLLVKAKCAINGPATFAIGISSQQKPVRADEQGCVTVVCNGTRYELLGADPDTVHVFPEAIPVEFKDGTKLGGLSDCDVSSVQEFKPPSTLKDSAIAEAVSVAQHDLKRFFAVYTQKYGCREFLAQIQEWNRNLVQPLDFSDYD